MGKVTLFHRVAYGNPDESIEVIRRYGYVPSRDPEANAKKLASIAMNYGEEALESIASIHPDKDLILQLGQSEQASNGSEKPVEEAPVSQPYTQTLSCDGNENCSCKKKGSDMLSCNGDPNCKCNCSGNKSMNADGEGKNANQTTPSFKLNIHPVVGILAITALALYFVKKSK